MLATGVDNGWRFYDTVGGHYEKFLPFRKIPEKFFGRTTIIIRRCNFSGPKTRGFDYKTKNEMKRFCEDFRRTSRKPIFQTEGEKKNVEALFHSESIRRIVLYDREIRMNEHGIISMVLFFPCG